MNKLTKIAISFLCILAMTSSVLADSLFLEETMLGRGRNLGKEDLEECKNRTLEIFDDGVQTLKPGNEVQLCLDMFNPDYN